MLYIFFTEFDEIGGTDCRAIAVRPIQFAVKLVLSCLCPGIKQQTCTGSTGVHMRPPSCSYSLQWGVSDVSQEGKTP